MGWHSTSQESVYVFIFGICQGIDGSLLTFSPEEQTAMVHTPQAVGKMASPAHAGLNSYPTLGTRGTQKGLGVHSLFLHALWLWSPQDSHSPSLLVFHTLHLPPIDFRIAPSSYQTRAGCELDRTPGLREHA